MLRRDELPPIDPKVALDRAHKTINFLLKNASVNGHRFALIQLSPIEPVVRPTIRAEFVQNGYKVYDPTDYKQIDPALLAIAYELFSSLDVLMMTQYGGPGSLLVDLHPE